MSTSRWLAFTARRNAREPMTIIISCCFQGCQGQVELLGNLLINVLKVNAKRPCFARWLCMCVIIASRPSPTLFCWCVFAFAASHWPWRYKFVTKICISLILATQNLYLIHISNWSVAGVEFCDYVMGPWLLVETIVFSSAIFSMPSCFFV